MKRRLAAVPWTSLTGRRAEKTVAPKKARTYLGKPMELELHAARMRERNQDAIRRREAAKKAWETRKARLELEQLKADFDWLDAHAVRVSDKDDKLIFFRAPGASSVRSYIAEARESSCSE